MWMIVQYIPGEMVERRLTFRSEVPGILGHQGGWSSNTLLATTNAFKTQYQQLSKDRSTGIFSNLVTFETPDEFDGRKVWSRFVQPIRNQGKCGACWAFSTVFVLQTRLAIATLGAYNYNLSPTEMVLCNMGSEHEFELAKKQIDHGDPYDFNLPDQRASVRKDEEDAVSKVGCGGETLLGSWQYLFRFGVPEHGCVTYDSKDDDDVNLFDYAQGDRIPTCADVFGDNYDICPVGKKKKKNRKHMQFHMSIGYYHVPGASTTQKDMTAGTEYDIRRDVYHWGPVSTGFDVHSDFMAWDGKGVYRWDKKSAVEGGHAVVIMGWGTDPMHGAYWIVRNSWGSYWGEDDGYFKISRGENQCNIEENVIVGLPNLYGFRLYLEWPLLHRTEDLALRALWGVRASGYKNTTVEAMILSKIPENLKISGDHSEVYGQQYDPNRWPDVSVMIAGDPTTIRFRIAESTSLMAHPFRYMGLHREFMVGMLVGTATAIIAVIVWKRMVRG
jgi:hypothetical protein